MGAKCAEVFAVDHNVRTPSGSGHPAHAHHDHALRQIRRLELREIQVPELQLEVRADALAALKRLGDDEPEVFGERRENENIAPLPDFLELFAKYG